MQRRPSMFRADLMINYRIINKRLNHAGLATALLLKATMKRTKGLAKPTI